MDTHSLKAFVEEQLRDREPMYGAQLGSLINAEDPTINLRVSYGGLRNFITKHCPALHVLRDVGGDDLYADSTDKLPTQDHSHSKPAVNAWQAFTIPDGAESLFADLDTGKVRISTADLSAPWTKIPSVSATEHFAISEAFLSHISEEDRPEFRKILDAGGDWQAWYRLVHLENRKYGKAWSRFRFQKLCELFLNRFNLFGADRSIATTALGHLKEIKSVHASSAPRDNRPTGGQSEMSMRQAAIVAIEHLSEDELRRLWLPLGSIYDAVRRVSP